ncbi:MAG: 2-amino-4-hydroxy-6-hydroxymethyldihydropteridine diphosphokinase [Chloroflexi bacterium]|nr:2-amino-4-hydroxy-6-hydroxymethyldihydropteridine diphosphokinase [Chloroflexota bacterium]
MSEARVYYVGLGSNLGNRAAALARAIARLDAHDRITVQRVSPVYETKAVADEPQPDYLNLVAAVETDLEPTQLLGVMQVIEDELGRVRPYRNAPRTIDLDLLVCATAVAPGAIMATSELTLPHPRMLERQFVLQPLADLAPDLRVGDSRPLGELVDRTGPDVRLVGELAALAGKDE